MTVPAGVRQGLNEVYNECVTWLKKNDPKKAELFEDLVEKPIVDRDGCRYVRKPIIVVKCRVVSGIKAPHKPLKSQLEFYIKLYGLDRLYQERAKHLDRIFLRSPDPVDKVDKPFLSGYATKASLPIPQWVFRYTISHLYLEGVKFMEEERIDAKLVTSDYVGIRMPHGTECFEYAPPKSEAKFYIFPDAKFWTYALKNMDIDYLSDLMKEATIIYTIFRRLIQHEQLRQTAIGSTSKGFGLVELEDVDVVVQEAPVETIEWIRNVVNRLSGLKQMPKTKIEEKKDEKKMEEKKADEKKESVKDKFNVGMVSKFVRQHHGGT